MIPLSAALWAAFPKSMACIEGVHMQGKVQEGLLRDLRIAHKRFASKFGHFRASSDAA
jgi:uncharacterized protein YhbP (UPF0306 family)